MNRVFLFAILSVFASAFGVLAEQPPGPKDSHEIVKTTYLITGLHCPSCTRTIESSLGHVNGVHSIRVDWKTKSARIKFDESILPAQTIARLIAGTPHMMGRNMRYDSWLALRVAEIENDESAKPVVEGLQKVEGIKRVIAYPKQHSVAVQFDSKGQLTDAQLISALTKAGYHAANP